VAERASLVAELTGDDVQLRQSVELLLSNHDATELGARVAAGSAAGAELAAGTVFDHYRIDAVLGRGGMGVVYRATDTKLNRPVAIKFLAAAVTNAEERRRFKQEAETTSGLNHPHIVTVYDVGEHDGQQYIVSELIDGGTLDDWSRVARRRTWRQSVELVVGVADALAAAHAAGVLHRDVKPGNILIDGNGYAKLADFGLAKLVDSGKRDLAGPVDASHHTRVGVVVGTIAYMSPEQATGQPLDARSDIFSFAIVLYELLAGRRPFEADNDLEVLKSIAHASPPPLPETVPEPLRAILDKALEKAPADRYQTMQDLVVDLRRLARQQPGSQSATSSAAERRRARVMSVVATGLAVALVAALVPVALYFLRPPPAPAPQIRLEMPVAGYAPYGLAISPDGERVAYAAVVNGVRRIWIRPLGAPTAHVLVGTEGAVAVFWSPDNRRLAFVADGKLQSIDVSGGSATAIADFTSPFATAGAWARDGTILFSMTNPKGKGVALGRVPSVGGTPTLVISPDIAGGEMGLLEPTMLPDGKHFLFASGHPTSDERGVHVGSLATPDRVSLFSFHPNALTKVAYAAGFLFYSRDATLVAQPFDADGLVVRGEAVPIAENVAEYSVAANALVYRTASTGPTNDAPALPRRLIWFDRTGQRLGEVDAPPSYRLPVLSPDGRRVSLSVARKSGFSDIWTIDTERGGNTPLTSDDATDDFTAWSPDGARIAFNSGRDHVLAIASSIYERAANGTGSDELLISGAGDEYLVPFDWSRDGRLLVFGRASTATAAHRFDLWVLEMSGEHRASPLIESSFIKIEAKLSPDGRWIAYATNESNRLEIVVQPFPEIERGKWPVSTRGGLEPHWRADGRELFYLDPDGVVMAVDVQAAGDVFEPGPPRPLFKTGLKMIGPGDDTDYLYNVTADGQRFLINERVAADPTSSSAPAAPETTSLNVIVNWKAGLDRK